MLSNYPILRFALLCLFIGWVPLIGIAIYSIKSGSDQTAGAKLGYMLVTIVCTALAVLALIGWALRAVFNRPASEPPTKLDLS